MRRRSSMPTSASTATAMPRHPPHAVWTPQQTSALLRIHKEEHASWVERGRPWGGYVFKNVASRLNAIPNLFPEPRTEMQCRMKLYSLKRARETSERRASEKQERSALSWKRPSDQSTSGSDASGEHGRDMHSKENTIRFDTELMTASSLERRSPHKRPRQHDPLSSSQRWILSSSHHHHLTLGNPRPPTSYPSYGSHPALHSPYSAGHPSSIPMPPPPHLHHQHHLHHHGHPPSSAAHPLPSPSYIADGHAYSQPSSYYSGNNGHTGYPPYVPPSASAPSLPPPPPLPASSAEWSHSPLAPRFPENYPAAAHTPQQKPHGTGHDASNYSAPSALQRRLSELNANPHRPAMLANGGSISPDGSPLSKVSRSAYPSASPNVPARPTSLSTVSTPTQSSGHGEQQSLPPHAAPQPMPQTAHVKSPMSDKGPDGGHAAPPHASSPEHGAPSRESYGYPGHAPPAIPPVSPHYYAAETGQQAAVPPGMPHNGSAYPSAPASAGHPKDAALDRHWADVVRMQREHERNQLELLERNRRELLAYMERQRESNLAQEERRWRRLVDLDMAREKKFTEREEKLIATLEAADARREKQLFEFERRMREEADAREQRWEKMLGNITRTHTEHYTRICELLTSASSSAEAAEAENSPDTTLTMVSTNNERNDDDSAIATSSSSSS
ncbi:hypothetical protein SYNPS1DRAFT_27749 [Syncephalis pseudoplumigaleata]|uniref:Myb-like domain-containing protein n=1 Tax=Syncephalis pseudoplumigaleata TaxID=1712513 RepID=A0A4P9Z245_9FUNG|nr:hypothetical protein SYNPS1DRAFT_27749 [Syncephalis pseudoplumigaleata]|eukprot:RKP26573.1 hypothetical protein SYNPS1DRAFT_27749 [Syncephalis pseudoplumigaleata]